MSDTHSNAPEKLSDMPLEHLSDFDWNRCPIRFRTGVRHELESMSDLACSTQQLAPDHDYRADQRYTPLHKYPCQSDCDWHLQGL